MTQLEVCLSSIRTAFQGLIPSPMATASAAGVPNSTYLSVVWYIDEERIAISNQYLGKTAANLRENPQVVLLVVDPTTMTDYRLEATYLRSDSSGEIFEIVRTQLEAVAAQSGMQTTFYLRAVEILRVDRCTQAGVLDVLVNSGSEVAIALSNLDVFLRRLSECKNLKDATSVALRTIEDLYHFKTSVLLLTDPSAESLFIVASNGYSNFELGTRVSITEGGAIGVAASRRRQVSLANLERLRLAGAIVPEDKASSGGAHLIGLEDAQSVLATPLLLHDRLIGVLYLDSSEAGRFDAEAAQLVEVLAGHLAVTVALHVQTEEDKLSPSSGAEILWGDGSGRVVAFHQHDGSVLVDGDYVIKGVAGRILFSMLDEQARSGRTEFSNREIRLDKSLELPVGNDNLEARLLTLRRRLARRNDPFKVERVGRGRLELEVAEPITLIRYDQ